MLLEMEYGVFFFSLVYCRLKNCLFRAVCRYLFYSQYADNSQHLTLRESTLRFQLLKRDFYVEYTDGSLLNHINNTFRSGQFGAATEIHALSWVCYLCYF
jgi:hypothetical protein